MSYLGERVGVIGLGNMGRGIAKNLAQSGWGLMAWDILPAARKPFEKRRGVEVAPPGELARACAAIIFVVPATPEILACVNGKDGIFANAGEGLVLYDFTTSAPEDTRRLAARVAKKGIAYIDAGMSGGPTGADAGRLTLMVGGDPGAFRRTKKFLTPVAKHIFYLGESGAGHTMKLIHNIVCHATFLATCEAGHLAERAGLQLADMVKVFNVSNARSYASEFRFPRHILSGKWDAKSRIYNLHKDLKMGVALGRRAGAERKFAEATLRFLEKAVARGMKDKDYALLYRDFEEIRKSPRRAKKKVG